MRVTIDFPMTWTQCKITPKKGQQNHLELLPKAAAKPIPQQQGEPLPFICLIKVLCWEQERNCYINPLHGRLMF